MFELLNKYICLEKERQKKNINLIASENICPSEISNISSCCLQNKYAEGAPKKRFYAGCKFIDEIEIISQKEACSLFNAEYSNLQPHSGTQANQIALMSLMNPRETLLSMDFSSGGHISHGHKLSIISKLYDVKTYSVNKNTELIDYDEILNLSKIYKPKVILAGTSSYPRLIDYKKIKEICNEVNAYFIYDMAHIAGLIAANVIPSPIEYADIITSTTHKTLRGIRGGFILSKRKFEEQINRAVLPGIQGGANFSLIAAKGLTFNFAKQNSFKKYSEQVLKNSKAMEEAFQENKIKMITDGTDTHMIIIDTIKSFDNTGKECEEILEKNGIIVNRNSIPFDALSPLNTSGIRIGTPFITSQNLYENDCKEIAKKIIKLLNK
jgi:glycine hydroxymethyltransferase